MKSFLFAFLVIAFAKESWAYYYDGHQAVLPVIDSAAQFGTRTIKGINGKNYEVTVSASRRMFERRLPSNEHVFIIQYFNLPAAGTVSYHPQQPYVYAPPALATTTAQEQQQPSLGNILPPYSYNVQNNLVNNPKYVSQSEAGKLDVYPYKQVNGNSRPFTRTISKCDASGRCVPLNSADDGISGDNDFYQQQVLELKSEAQDKSKARKCQNEAPQQLTGYVYEKNNKGTDLKGRRQLPYSEVILPQFTHN